MNARHLSLVALLAVAVLLAAEPGLAHQGGKAEPRIAAGVSQGPGLVRLITVRVTDVDSREPMRGATVVAFGEMTVPHTMRTPRWRLGESASGIYQARVKFLMPGEWTVTVAASGKKVVTATSGFPITIERAAEAQPSPASPTPSAQEGVPDLTALPTTVEDELAQRDVAAMAVLWLHGLAAMGWIIGVLVMVLALSARPAVVAEAIRERLARAYRSWGAWLHWSLVPVIVGTGVYNMLYVTPFPLAWRPEQFAALQDVAYGPLYEAILIVKLGLFAALLVTGTQVLLRTVRSGGTPALSANPHFPGFLRTLAGSLGPAGIFYVATVPLILAAAMALRYVHVLSHVAEVLRSA